MVAVAEVSRPPQHNPAGPDFATYKDVQREIENAAFNQRNRLATKPGLIIREECTTQDKHNPGLRSLSLGRCVNVWREWMESYQDSNAVFEHETKDKKIVAPMQNRFMEERATKLYAQLKDLERGVCEAWGKANVTTVMLTFTASTSSANGEWQRCLGNHLDDLLSTWPQVRREIGRALDGREYEYVRILEPHKSGHAHIHVAVFVRGPVEAEAFRSVMKRHVNNCLPASREAHRVEGEDAAVSVKRGVDNIAAYVASYIGSSLGDDPLEAPIHEQAFMAMLWALNRRRVSFSNGCRDLMTFEPPEPSEEWELTHFEREGELFPNNPQRVEEPYLVELGEGGQGLDPPPDRGRWE